MNTAICFKANVIFNRLTYNCNTLLSSFSISPICQHSCRSWIKIILNEMPFVESTLLYYVQVRSGDCGNRTLWHKPVQQVWSKFNMWFLKCSF